MHLKGEDTGEKVDMHVVWEMLPEISSNGIVLLGGAYQHFETDPSTRTKRLLF